MSWIKQLLQRWRGPAGQAPPLPIDEGGAPEEWSLQNYLMELAAEEQRPVEEVTRQLLEEAVRQQKRKQAEERRLLWRALTPRLKEVATLMCEGLNNAAIAEKLIISENTVKTHVRAILTAFDVKDRRELRRLLEEWNVRGKKD